MVVYVHLLSPNGSYPFDTIAEDIGSRVTIAVPACLNSDVNFSCESDIHTTAFFDGRTVLIIVLNLLIR